jgi:hypothetical protein
MHDAQPDFDNAWKEALDIDLPAFLLLRPDIHADLHPTADWVSLDAELRQLELPGELAGAGVIADRLIRLQRRTGDEAILHLEVTITSAAHFARRMSLYNDRASEKLGLPVASLTILGDDSPTWRPHVYEQTLWSTHKRFEFVILKLLDFAEQQEALLAGNTPFGWLIVAHLQARRARPEVERRAWRMRLWRRQRDAGLEADARRRWERCFEWLLPLTPAVRNQMMTELQPEERRTNVSLWDTFLDHMRIEAEKVVRVDTETKVRNAEQHGLTQGQAESVRLGMELLYGQADEALLRRLAELNSPTAYQAVQSALRARGDVQSLWAVLPTTS